MSDKPERKKSCLNDHRHASWPASAAECAMEDLVNFGFAAGPLQDIPIAFDKRTESPQKSRTDVPRADL